jgi:hypothetical protein
LVLDDGGRAAADIAGVTDGDCVTRSIAIGTGLPYADVHAMVNATSRELGQGDNAAESGAYPMVTAKLLAHDRDWRVYELGPSARLTIEDLSGPLSRHAALVVEVEAQGTYHVTAVVNREVHDLATFGSNGYARTERVKNVFGCPLVLETFEHEARYLLDPHMRGLPIWLRLDGDSDDPNTWHPVKTLNEGGFREDVALPFGQAITVEFDDATTEIILNENDEVEFALPGPNIQES